MTMIMITGFFVYIILYGIGGVIFLTYWEDDIDDCFSITVFGFSMLMSPVIFPSIGYGFLAKLAVEPIIKLLQQNMRY